MMGSTVTNEGELSRLTVKEEASPSYARTERYFKYAAGAVAMLLLATTTLIAATASSGSDKFASYSLSAPLTRGARLGAKHKKGGGGLLSKLLHSADEKVDKAAFDPIVTTAKDLGVKLGKDGNCVSSCASNDGDLSLGRFQFIDASCPLHPGCAGSTGCRFCIMLGAEPSVEESQWPVCPPCVCDDTGAAGCLTSKQLKAITSGESTNVPTASDFYLQTPAFHTFIKLAGTSPEQDEIFAEIDKHRAAEEKAAAKHASSHSSHSKHSVHKELEPLEGVEEVTTKKSSSKSTVKDAFASASVTTKHKSKNILI